MRACPYLLRVWLGEDFWRGGEDRAYINIFGNSLFACGGKTAYVYHSQTPHGWNLVHWAALFSVVCQFLDSPCDSHWHAVVRILKYIKGSPRKGLIYTDRGHTDIIGYLDVDWVGDASDRWCTSSYCIFMGGNLEEQNVDFVVRSSIRLWLRHVSFCCRNIYYRSCVFVGLVL